VKPIHKNRSRSSSTKEVGERNNNGGLISAPQIPAGIRCIPEEYKLAEGSANIAIPVVSRSGGIQAFQN